MAGSEPPYLYDPPSSRRSVAYPYSDFNPKAVTQQHYQTLAERAERQRQKAFQDGKPLINFNQHPDSYMIVGGQAPQYEPMPKNTKKWIATTRWMQLALRLIQEIGALGMLVCFICLKMPLDGQGWVLRIAPAWDAVVSMYAIYHLIRPAKGRTPGSSGSYHFFALFMDTGMIPFYIFIVLLANQNYNLQPGVDGRWTSFFTSEQATSLLIFVTFIGGIVLSALHFISISIDLYLIVMFRRIARLPPDMNPLEDNLTARPTRTHKHKNSEVTATSDVMSEKQKAHLSGSTLSVDQQSHLSAVKGPEARVMPFGHSRMGSDISFSPHNPDSARLSRQQFEAAGLYDGPRSTRSSRQDLPMDRRSRPASPSKHGSFYEELDENRMRSPRPDSFMSSPVAKQDHFNNPAMHNFAQSDPPVRRPIKEPVHAENWYSLEDDQESDMGSPHRQRASAPAHPPAYTQIPVHERHDSFEPQPLKMNPPTPPNAHDEYADADNFETTPRRQHNRYEPVDNHDERTMTMESHASTVQASSVYSDDAPTITSGSKFNSGTPKGKYYGDLAAATRGVRGGSPFQRPATTLGGYTDPALHAPRSPSPQKGRVISRTGVDITDAAGYYVPDQQHGMRSRRDVSGKLAEEGRGGWETRKR